LRQIHSGARADLRQPIPLIHAKLAYSNFDVESIVIIHADSTVCKTPRHHILMCILAALYFRNEPSPRFRKVANATGNKALPPEVLLAACSGRPPSCADADEDADFSAGPLVDNGFVKSDWRRIVLSTAFIQKYRLSDLDGFKCKLCGARRTARLPNSALLLRGSLFS
jgi:hypothetical protein